MYFFPIENDVWDDFKQNGRDYEYSSDQEDKVVVLHHNKKKNKKPLPTECVFCKNNGEDAKIYKKHLLKDVEGRTICPILRYVYEFYQNFTFVSEDWYIFLNNLNLIIQAVMSIILIIVYILLYIIVVDCNKLLIFLSFLSLFCRKYTCPICGAKGDSAHTLKYCPLNKQNHAVAPMNALKALRNSTGRRRSK